MTSTKKDPVLVVLQLTGGNDYLNTMIPYTDPLYKDNRPNVRIPDEDILRLDDEVGLHPSMGPIANLYNQGKGGHHPWRGLRRLTPLPLPGHG